SRLAAEPRGSGAGPHHPGEAMTRAALTVIGSVVLASAMLAASDARASLETYRTIAPFERVVAVTDFAVGDFVPGTPVAAQMSGDVEAPGSVQQAAPALEKAGWLAARESARGAMRPASTPSSSTRKVTRPPASHRRHARLHHSDPSLRAHHP